MDILMIFILDIRKDNLRKMIVKEIRVLLYAKNMVVSMLGKLWEGSKMGC